MVSLRTAGGGAGADAGRAVRTGPATGPAVAALRGGAPSRPAGPGQRHHHPARSMDPPPQVVARIFVRHLFGCLCFSICLLDLTRL